MNDIELRRLGTVDRADAISLAAGALGWTDDLRDQAFFAWKHDENPYGLSPSWGAFQHGQLVGFRTFLRWRFEQGGRPLEMVRAVDTATHPRYQGQGIFKRLTLHAVQAMTSSGLDAVFNTPNDQSRPGYLSMGWHSLGRPTISMQPDTPWRVLRMLRGRQAAEKWSVPVTLGQPATEVGDDLGRAVGASIRRLTVAGFSRWRYGFEPLHYRAVDIRGGLMVFRVRRRGELREVAIVEWRSVRSDLRAVHRLVREVGDYAVGVGLPSSSGFLPLPRVGPVVTWRPLARPGVPSLRDLKLDLGDLELF